MSDTTLLWWAMFVFAMLVVGLGLTMLEFRYGQPRREDEQARTARERSAPRAEEAPVRARAE